MMKVVRLSNWQIFLLILFINFVVYGNTFLNQWTYDDNLVILNNPDSQSLAGFMENSYPGRPMRELTHIPEYKLFGEKPAGYHFQQLLWHTANGFLLFLLFSALGIEALYAFLGIVLFTVHPLQSESVASIAHRKELLPLFFSLCSLLAYMKAVSSAGGKRMGLLLLSVTGYGAALLSNPTAAPLPLVIVLYDFLFLGKDDRIVLKRPVLLFLLFLLAGAVVLYFFRGFFSWQHLGTIYAQNHFFASKQYYPLLLATLRAFGLYLLKILFPLNLSPEYVITFSKSLFQWTAYLSLLFIAGSVVIFIRSMRSFNVIAFGIGWFLILYLPVSNIIPAGYIMADRYMYLCLPGVALLFAAILQRYPRSSILRISCAVLAILALLTVIQNNYWRSNRTLWQHAVKLNPDSTGANHAMASDFKYAHEWEKAERHLKKVLKLNRFYVIAYYDLAFVQEQQGKLDEALKNYEMFVALDQGFDPDKEDYARKHLPVLKEKIRVRDGG